MATDGKAHWKMKGKIIQKLMRTMKWSRHLQQFLHLVTCKLFLQDMFLCVFAEACASEMDGTRVY